MHDGKAVGPDGIPVEVRKSLGEEGVDMLLHLLRAGENVRGMEGQCDCTNLQSMSVRPCSQTAGRNSCSIVSGDVTNCSYRLTVHPRRSSRLSSA